MIPTSVNEVLNISSSERQRLLGSWVRLVFGEADMSRTIRALRLLEEAIELAQAMRLPERRALKLVRHVYKRAPGKVDQEIGGVGVTLLALAECCSYDAERCTASELARIASKDSAHFRERNAEKNKAGFGEHDHCEVSQEKPDDELIEWAISAAINNGEGSLTSYYLRLALASQNLTIVPSTHIDGIEEPEPLQASPNPTACDKCGWTEGRHDLSCSKHPDNEVPF